MESNEPLERIVSASALTTKLVELNKSATYHLFYRLLALALTLPVSTASTERTVRVPLARGAIS
jgi:hypothetical protein